MTGSERTCNTLRLNTFMQPTGETTRASGRTGELPVVLYLAPWAFVLLAAIKLKHRILVAEGGGFDFLAELLGKGHGGALSTLQRVALYRDDVLLAGVVGSIAYIAFLKVVPSRWRALAAWAVTTSLFLVLYSQLKAWWEVGTFISARLMVDGLFGPGRELISEYAASKTVLKLFLSLGAMAATCITLYVLERKAAKRRLDALARVSSWGLVAAGAGIVMASWVGNVPITPYQRAATSAALTAFVDRASSVDPEAELERLTPRELVARYAKIANAPVPNARSPYFGKARGYDVVFLLLESTPEACYGMPGADKAMPNLRALEHAAFLPAAHYSTYPYSRRAYSSIFSSWYPLNGIRGAIERYGRVSRDLRAPGVIHSASIEGYETVAFVPERPVTLAEDELRYDALGFLEHEVPPSAYEKPEGFELDNSHRDWVRVRDRESFNELKARVRQAIDDDRRYMFSFNPQVTHGPWPGIQASSTRDETCRAGFGLLGEVDSMLGELVSLLREKGRLDRTLIVALGDHGLRTRREYPPFHAGTLDDVTFHVPLVLYAPGVLATTKRIEWMTSHIDIAPSVLDLLGIEADRSLELGSPMWDPRLADRATFFFARGYLGADGYQRESEAVMVRYLYGGVSRSAWNGSLDFQASDLLHQPDRATMRSVEELNTMAAIQAQLARTMLPSSTKLRRAPGDRRAATALRLVSTQGPAMAPPVRTPKR